MYMASTLLPLPEGKHVLRLTYLGYANRDFEINLMQNISSNFELIASENMLKRSRCNSLRGRSDARASADVKNGSTHQAAQVASCYFRRSRHHENPSASPGVQSGGEGTSGLYVRGGSPDQNLILLDGVPIYNVNHLFGFFSVFNADAISNVSLTKGGFPARYGGRLSSVLEINMKEGNLREFHGDATASIIASKITLEGATHQGQGIVYGFRATHLFRSFSKAFSG